MSSKRKYAQLTALCTAVYFTSYISRINLAAVMVELIQSGFAEKQAVALALTVCSVTYGLGQIVSGWMGDRFKPQNVIVAGFLLTAAMNLGVALLRNPSLLVILWAVNGFAQACMWPPLLAVMTSHFTQDEYSRACVWVSWGSAFGTICVYACSPLLIRLGGFRTVFAVSGTAALVMALVWKILYEKNFGTGAIQKTVQIHAEPPVNGKFNSQVLILMGLIMAAIVAQGALRDGVSNWMPTFVCESFGLDSSSAILTGVLLPIFQIICIKVASWLYRRVLTNEVAASGAIFAVGTAASLLLTVFMGKSVLSTALLMALLVGCMHGVNFILVSMTPPHFRKYGHVSLVSGVLNCSTYVGSAVSTYGIALLSESLGWKGTSLLWAGIAAAGAVICLVIARKWHTFKNQPALLAKADTETEIQRG